MQWDIETGKKSVFSAGRKHVKEGSAHHDEIVCTVVARDQRMLCTAGKDRFLKIWDVRSGGLVH